MTEISTQEIKEALEGLLEIAEMAMPDTYFATDSRVAKAKEVLKTLDK